MTQLYKDNENLRKWVRNLMALVLLPAENIEPTFRILSSQSTNLTTTQHCKVQQLNTYYKKYWLKQVGCEKNVSCLYKRVFIWDRNLRSLRLGFSIRKS